MLYIIWNVCAVSKQQWVDPTLSGPTESIRYGSASSLYCMGYISIAYTHFRSSQIKRFRMALLLVLVPLEKVDSSFEQTDSDTVMP